MTVCAVPCRFRTLIHVLFAFPSLLRDFLSCGCRSPCCTVWSIDRVPERREWDESRQRFPRPGVYLAPPPCAMKGVLGGLFDARNLGPRVHDARQSTFPLQGQRCLALRPRTLFPRQMTVFKVQTSFRINHKNEGCGSSFIRNAMNLYAFDREGLAQVR